MLDRKDNIMKNIAFTYDSRMDGEQGEACMTVMVDDERAAEIKAAFDAKSKSGTDVAAIIRRSDAEHLCYACERLRGRHYIDNSIKMVEVKEV